MGRLALALALIAAGAALFAAAGRSGDSTRNGGVFRYGTTGASVQIDPQQGYVTTSWWLEYATALKLVNWPDRPALPAPASYWKRPRASPSRTAARRTRSPSARAFASVTARR